MSQAAREQSRLPEGRVALLFTDIEGSTALLQSLGASYGALLDQHDRILRGVWQEFDGVEVDNEGDAFFVVFTDHEKAAAAASEVVRRCAGAQWPAGAELRVRIALHSGQPRVRGRRYWGIDVNYAARLCSASHGGQVLLSSAMRRALPEAAVDSLGEHGVKDFTSPRELFHLVVEGVRATNFPPPRTLAVGGTNLPTAASRIIGRESVLTDICTRLGEGGARLVTIVGPGGIGKTRVALECGERLVDRFPDGVVFVPLAAVANVEAAYSAIAEATGTPRSTGVDADQLLLARLTGQARLLILDNAEHLPGLADFVARLVGIRGAHRLLVTSQVPLGVRDESVMRLGPLELPAEVADVDAVTAAPAVVLLQDRANAAERDFHVDAENAADVARLVRLLDGVPLAVELAAARVHVGGIRELVRALERNMDVLGSGSSDLPVRQRGLRAALEWTVSLLAPAERDTFISLGAFASAWSLEQAEQLLADQLNAVDVWDALSRLVDLGLVMSRGDGRFAMPERVQRHAEELLELSPQGTVMRDRHAELVAEQWGLYTVDFYVDVLRVLANAEDSVEEALRAVAWTADHDEELCRRVVASVAAPLFQLGRLPLIADHVQRLAADRACADRSDGFLHLAAALVHEIGYSDMPGHLAAARRALTCLRETGTPVDIAAVGFTLVLSLVLVGDLDGARQTRDEIVRDTQGIQDRRWSKALSSLEVVIMVPQGELDAARERLDSLSREPARTDAFAVFADSYRADVELMSGNNVEAIRYFGRMLAKLPSSNLDNVILQIHGIAIALIGLGRDADARILLSGMRGAYRTLTGKDLGFEDPDFTAALEALDRRSSELQWQEAVQGADDASYDDVRRMALAFAADVERSARRT